jgi:restriction system protein
MSAEYHYAPDFLNLLVEALARLNRSKNNVILFFQGAGVPARYLADLSADLKRDKNSHTKFDIARTILVRLNEAGDGALAQRREIVKRIVEFEDFTRCWDNDVLPAKGLVAEVRRLVNVKDSFTRMNIERARERDETLAARESVTRDKLARNKKIEAAKGELFALFAESDPYRRAIALEGVLARLFDAFEILVREAFTVKKSAAGIVEQIDGAIELDGHVYFVEVKWWDAPLGAGDTAQHLVRIFARDGARGLFISASGYTAGAVEQYAEALRQRVVVLCTLEEIVKTLVDGRDLDSFLAECVKAAILDKTPWARKG